MASKIELYPDQTILFIGDSITDCGRREAGYQPLVGVMLTLLQICCWLSSRP